MYRTVKDLLNEVVRSRGEQNRTSCHEGRKGGGGGVASRRRGGDRWRRDCSHKREIRITAL